MQIIEKIIDWYSYYKRDLPWRNTKNPYKIWLSEIILQQTKVIQGLEHYHRFEEKFPTIEVLANAKEDEVLKLWQGLGYYSRARNLHATAKIIQSDFDGVFPQNFYEIKKLKGIGDYTAAAIASFSYNLPHACVDGNVYRVLSRVFGISTPIDSVSGKKEFATLANNLLPKNNAATYNQAMMEFGALQCVPKNPTCELCVINTYCFAFINKTVESLPVKKKKAKQRNRYFYYLFIEDNKGNAIINQRIKKDIWQHLFEFPLIEYDSNQEINTILNSKSITDVLGKVSFKVENISKQYKHILSHQIIYATFIHLKVDSLSKIKNSVKVKNLSNFAVSRLTHMYMQDVNIEK